MDEIGYEGSGFCSIRFIQNEEEGELTARDCVLAGVLTFISLYRVDAQTVYSDYPVPQIRGPLGVIPDKFTEHVVVLEPDKNEREWWAGAPSVVRDEKGVFWMACRMRTADSPRGKRGYEVRILKSEDGMHFVVAQRIRRESVPISGFERPALVRDPQTGLFKLYCCGPWENDTWTIIKMDDSESPDCFDPASAHPVISPRPKRWERDIPVTGYKDPFVLYAEGNFHCYVIGYIRQTERIFHYKSADGEQWQPVGDPHESLLPLGGWHDFFVRPACLLPVGVGYLFIYEGSNTSWYDPVYNVVTGLGFTFDLHNVIDLTSTSPLVCSTTPGSFHTWRYSHWLWVDDELWVYAEVARTNDSNEIRLFRVKK